MTKKGLILDSGPNQLNEQAQPQFNMNMTTEIFCEKCNSNMFDRSYALRKVPALIAGKEGVLPIPIFKCQKCGHVNEDLFPKFNQ